MSTSLRRFSAKITGFGVFSTFLFLGSIQTVYGTTILGQGDTVASLEFQLQAIGSLSKGQAGTAAGDPTQAGDFWDLYLKQARVVLDGHATPLADFYLQLASDAVGKNYSTSQGMKALDAWVQFNLGGPAMKLMGGIYPVPFTRGNLTYNPSFVTVERPIMELFLLDSAGLDEKRGRGAQIWGNMANLQYHFSMGNGTAPLSPGSQNLRTTGRVHAALLEPETDYLYRDTYGGGRKIFTVGYGFDSQDGAVKNQAGLPSGYYAWTADAHLEGSSESGGVTTLDYAYYSINYGNELRTDTNGFYAQGQGWQGMLAYMVKGSAFQPYLRWSMWEPSVPDTGGAVQSRRYYGFNYLLKGYNIKMGFELEQVRFTTEGATFDKRNYDKYDILWQIVF